MADPVWIDVPGSELGSRDDALRFTYAGEVEFIKAASVDGSRVEEFVYSGGTFGPKYTTSTHVGNLYTLRREGGWPEDVRLSVEPAVVLPSSGLGMAPIYEVDLTTKGSLNMQPAGLHTIDGKSWWSKGSAAFGGTVFNALVSGSGLRAAATAFGVSGNMDHQMLWFPFAQLIDFNPSAPYAVVWRWAGTGLTDSTHLVAGIASMPDSTTVWLSADRASQMTIRYDGYSGGAANLSSYTTGDSQGYGVTPLSPANATLGSNVFAVGMAGQRVGYSAHAPYAGTLPTNVFLFSSGMTARRLGTHPSNPGFYFTRNQAADVYLTHLAVLQPKVVAA